MTMDDNDDGFGGDNTVGADSLEALLLVEKLLGTAMRSRPVFDKLKVAGAAMGDFEKIQHGDMWLAMLAVEAKHGRVEPTLVGAYLRENMDWRAGDVRQWLGNAEQAASGRVTEDDVTLALERVRYAAGVRQVRALGMRLMDEAKARQKSIADIAGSAAKEIEQIVANTTTRVTIKDGLQLMTEMGIRLASERRESFIRIPTGISEFDTMMRGGYREGKFLVYAADMGQGKTTFMASFIIAALEAGHYVHLKTFEAEEEEIENVLVEMKAGVRILDCNTPMQWARIAQARTFFATKRFKLEIVQSLTIEEIVAKMHAARLELTNDNVDTTKVGLVMMVDYFQDITRSTRHQRDDLNFAHMSIAFRRACDAYKVAGVMLSQIGEPKDQQASKIAALNGPSAGQIAYTKQLGKDAAYIIMGDRPSEDEDPVKANTTRLKLVKNRIDKETGRAYRRYDRKTTQLSKCNANGSLDNAMPGMPARAGTTQVALVTDDEDDWLPPDGP